MIKIEEELGGSSDIIYIDGKSHTLEDVVSVARKWRKVALYTESIRKLRNAVGIIARKERVL